MKKLIILLLLSMMLMPLIAEDSAIPTVNFDEVAAGKLRAGVEVGNYISGFTAGYRLKERIEINATVGTPWSLDSMAMGSSVLITLVNLDIQEQKFFVTAGPLAYFVFTDPFEIAVGGIGRVEYDFQFPLNLYLQGGVSYNFAEDKGIQFPFALGARYIF